ncbi:RNA ligase/cyclic nucleotide phosphodiesterase [Morchella snyderi]|nr:RNA ligase/cyclic nucleotide phosphodiesterase [Morchella snyderi]
MTVDVQVQQLFIDFSGLPPPGTPPHPGTPPPPTPYDTLIAACHDSPALIQHAYETHRTTRNAHQRAQLLAPAFAGMHIDPILQELLEAAAHPRRRPDEIDTRNCLTLWARPPAPVRALVSEVQARLQALCPDIWLMPLANLHLTVLEIAHSLTRPEIDAITTQLRPALPHMVNLATASEKRRAALIRPLLSFDSAALALSFVTEAADGSASTYTYHHLRRDLHQLAVDRGAPIGPRYTVPSAHITVARFVTGGGVEAWGAARREAWVAGIEAVNAWIGREWRDRLRWVVGEERGVEFRSGVLWYGGGEAVAVGKPL